MNEGGYRIRRYEPADRSDVIALFEREGEMRKPVEWFDWRFREIPFTPSVPLTVAEHDGQVVALRSSLPIPMSVNGNREVARLHADAIVHPDHRRRGLFSRIVESDHQRFLEGEARISYGTPNAKSLPALRNHERVPIQDGVLQTVPEYYHIPKIAPFLGALVGRRLGDYGDLERAILLSQSKDSRQEQFADGGDTKVKRFAEVPAGSLASITSDSDRIEVHAIRDEPFYRWRCANPWYEYTTYVVEKGGVTVASAVVEAAPFSDFPFSSVRPRSTGFPPTVGRIIDVRPLPGSNTTAEGWGELAAAIVADTDSVYLSTMGSRFPGNAISTASVRSIVSEVATRVKSRLASEQMLIAWPIREGGGTAWRLNGLDLSLPANWQLARCELKVF